MLCQIEKCCVYAKKENRTVIVDTDYSENETWHDSFDRYFTSTDDSLILSLKQIGDSIDNMTVYPESMINQLHSYKVKFNKDNCQRYNIETGEILSFNFNQSYPHQLLLHHQEGGGLLSINALKRLRLNKQVVEELLKRLKIIGGEYTGVHVRNTDHQTDYYWIIDKVLKSNTNKLFLATDSSLVLDDFYSANFKGEIFNFTRILSTDGKPIHTSVDNKNVYDRNIDCILDVLLLALSKDLHILPIKKIKFSLSYSGYSRLAKNLSDHKDILKSFINDSRVKISNYDLLVCFLKNKVWGRSAVSHIKRNLKKMACCFRFD
jgi:hypothetical protein